jgi:hypothetical protein
MPSQPDIETPTPLTAMERFGLRLTKHLDEGTRPPGRGTRTWTLDEFARAVGYRDGNSAKNWREGKNLPRVYDPLEFALFGKDSTKDNDTYRAWRSELRKLFEEAAEEKAIRLEKTLLKKIRTRQAGSASAETGSVPVEAATGLSEPAAAGATISVPRAPRLFLGREDTLDAIHAILSDHTDRGGSVVLYGLGGVGKTSLVAAYYQRHQRDYRACFWIRAETSETIQEDLAAIKSPHSAGKEPAIDRLARLAVDTLLIYDNAEDARSLRPYLPPHGGARILVTSNDHAWESVGAPIELSTWPKEVGANFLMARSGQRNGPRDIAETLSAELGGLPLAHEQAAAFCEKLSVSLAEYTKRFDKQLIKLLSDERYAPIEHRRSVAKTFSIAIDAATKLHSAAGQFILLVSLLGPHDIPLFVFEENYDRLPAPLKTAIQNGELEEVIAALRSFSLVEFEKPHLSGSESIRYINLHRLVRLVVLETCDPDTRQAAKILSFKALSAAIGKFDGVSEYTRNYGSNSIEPPMAPRFRAVFPIVRHLVDSEDKEAHEYFIHFYMPMKFGPLYYRYD